MSDVFKPRTTKPEAGNKYYIRKENGGYSRAIKGKPTDADCDVLSNCVGYAYGRFNEIGGWGKCKYLSPVNAEQFMEYKGSLESGNTPKLGACMVWQKGNTLKGGDGAGHVAIVEKVISDTEVLTSESAYGGKAFYTKTRKKGSNGKWGAGSSYKFLGFIYNPAPCCQTTTPEPETTTETHKVGEVVQFTGTKHYSSANAKSGRTCKPGKATVTSTYKIGTSKHPYHLKYVSGGGSTVYGWVDAADIKTETVTTTVKTRTHTVVKGDSLYKIGKKYGVSWLKIANANGVKFPWTIYAGQVLTIPEK